MRNSSECEKDINIICKLWNFWNCTILLPSEFIDGDENNIVR